MKPNIKPNDLLTGATRPAGSVTLVSSDGLIRNSVSSNRLKSLVSELKKFDLIQFGFPVSLVLKDFTEVFGFVISSI